MYKKYFFGEYRIMNTHNEFIEISPLELANAHKLIGEDWMLITARDGEKTNAMTASWGALGELWGKHVAVCFIRPQRHTFALAENEDRLSLAFLGEEYRSALKICGSKSGRDCDKLSLAELTHSEYDGVPIINEANTVVICRKLYADDIKEDCFVDRTLLEHYKAGDYHRMYILEIEKVLKKI